MSLSAWMSLLLMSLFSVTASADMPVTNTTPLLLAPTIAG